MTSRYSWLADALERTVLTFVETGVATFGTILAAASVLDMSTVKAAGVSAFSAGLAAAIAFAKSALARHVGDEGTASLVKGV
jgi:hypothetical protein